MIDMTGFVVVLTAIIAVAAILFIWKSVASEPGSMGDGSVGSVMDGNEDVRRIDLGQHMYVAQRAVEELQASDVNCRVVTLESGAFGIGLGNNHYLVYNAEDQDLVKSVVDRLLAE